MNTKQTETKFTPGPWKITHENNVYGPVVTETYDERLPMGSDNLEAFGGYLIAESTIRPNAHLIAAAPDLYEACVAVLDLMRRAHQTHDCPPPKMLHYMDSMDSGFSGPISELLEHAIAKARGEAT